MSLKWFKIFQIKRASLVAQRLKHLPPMRETWVRSLGWEDPLEKEMAIHSSILAWRIPWMEKPSRLQSTELQRVGHDWSDLAAAVAYDKMALISKAYNRFQWNSFQKQLTLINLAKSFETNNKQMKWSVSCSVMFDYLPPHGLYSPWNSLGQNTEVGSLFLFQGIFPTQGSNPGLPHCRRILY